MWSAVCESINSCVVRAEIISGDDTGINLNEVESLLDCSAKTKLISPALHYQIWLRPLEISMGAHTSVMIELFSVLLVLRYFSESH